MKRHLILKSFIVFLFLIIYSLVGSRLINAENDYQTDIVKNASILTIFLLFLGGAIIETLIFNNLIIFLLKKIFKHKIKNFLIIIIASIIFGLGHYSSFKFFIITAIVGVVLNYNFIIYFNQFKNYFYAFLSTFCIHFLSNFTVYLIDEYFNLF